MHTPCQLYKMCDLHGNDCSDCGFLGYDSVVLYRDTNVAEKHAASIFSTEVCKDGEPVGLYK